MDTTETARVRCVPVRVDAEWFPEDSSALDALWDGASWDGGWIEPLMTRGAVEEALDRGLIAGPGEMAFLDGRTDALVLVRAVDGTPRGRHRLASREAVMAHLDQGETAFVSGGTAFEVERSPGIDIDVEGESVHAWRVGFGLAWNMAPPLDETPVPAPR